MAVAPPTGRAAALVDRLQLLEHPEGGYYREIYRSTTTVHAGDHRTPRAAATSIYFLLIAGQMSRWHRVLSDEIWHFCEGDPIEIFACPPSLDRIERLTLRPSIDGEPIRLVPAGWWQAARTTGAYGLAGCTVAPGFDFADFAFLRDQPDALAALRRLDPALATMA